MLESMTDECLICFEETTQFAFFPCAHKVCIECKKRLSNTCPMCNYVDPEAPEPQPLRVQPVRVLVHKSSDSCSRICALFILTFASYVAYETINRTIL